jgi:hypothetical protein
MGAWKEEEGNILRAAGGVRAQSQHAAPPPNECLLIQKQSPRNRFLGAVQTQPVAVIFLIFPHRSVRNFFRTHLLFPLDNGQKQPMMWRKVGQSGQQ